MFVTLLKFSLDRLDSTPPLTLDKDNIQTNVVTIRKIIENTEFELCLVDSKGNVLSDYEQERQKML